ncbi:glycosyltransferase family A protein [Salinisphaera sp. G21_0]|uniref:glycosyltransferase family 2 protein n=1 Tax=Salinisphaera sp. G21_0 TaxID=2821094 RepID=UPI001ADAB6A6|nr:glycosyltransferase family A protein [Salinisphaera sp. G21_0]MBO9484011.1 glycosyltransferase family 2 protein [Salinisphaera sp. G21_0]
MRQKTNLENCPRVAVITRTKDRPIMLERALESVSKQSFKNFVWVVVNDGGDKEKAEKIVAKGKKKGLTTLLINNSSSLGMEAASNCGINNSSSKFIVIHDDDDTWDPLFLEDTVRFLDTNKNYRGVISLTTQVDEEIIDNKIKIKKFKAFNSRLKTIYLKDMGCNNLFPPISFIYHRSVINEIGSYNEKLPVLGDWEFNLRFLAKHDIGVIYKPLAFYHHRPRSTGAYGNTIYSGITKHVKYDAIVRNDFLRKDLKDGKFGLGFLMNYSQQDVHLTYRFYLKNLLARFIEKIKNLFY